MRWKIRRCYWAWVPWDWALLLGRVSRGWASLLGLGILSLVGARLLLVVVGLLVSGIVARLIVLVGRLTLLVIGVLLVVGVLLTGILVLLGLIIGLPLVGILALIARLLLLLTGILLRSRLPAVLIISGRVIDGLVAILLLSCGIRTEQAGKGVLDHARAKQAHARENHNDQNAHDDTRHRTRMALLVLFVKTRLIRLPRSRVALGAPSRTAARRHPI